MFKQLDHSFSSLSSQLGFWLSFQRQRKLSDHLSIHELFSISPPLSWRDNRLAFRRSCSSLQPVRMKSRLDLEAVCTTSDMRFQCPSTWAVSRDLLCYAMHNLSNQQICGHVHDELIIECPENTTVNSITSVMGKSPDWMKDILIRGDGYDTKFYKKD